MPDTGCADQVGVFAERSQGEFRLFKRHEPASLRNHFSEIVETYALHHAAAQDNPVRHKQVDQVGQTQPEVMRLTRDGLLSQRIAFFRKLENFFGAWTFRGSV